VISNSAPTPKIPAITVGLYPFDPSLVGGNAPSAVSTLLATISARPEGGVRFVFTLEGRIESLRIPEADVPSTDPLWQHTCFEAFLAAPDREGYCEYNFSPAGTWAAYRFRRYREFAHTLDEEALIASPVITTTTRRNGVLTLEADMPPAFLPSSPILRAGLAAVLEYGDGHLEYRAIHHPAERPDFHHASGWALLLDTRMTSQ
jgi:hypothetical protein